MTYKQCKLKLEALFKLSRYYLKQNNIEQAEITQNEIRHYCQKLLEY